jgi:hypothetical protein
MSVKTIIIVLVTIDLTCISIIGYQYLNRASLIASKSASIVPTIPPTDMPSLTPTPTIIPTPIISQTNKIPCPILGKTYFITENECLYLLTLVNIKNSQSVPAQPYIPPPALHIQPVQPIPMMQPYTVIQPDPEHCTIIGMSTSCHF